MDAMTRHEKAMAILREGTVIPATTLALDENRQFDEAHQRLLTRYYLEAGSWRCGYYLKSSTVLILLLIHRIC